MSADSFFSRKISRRDFLNGVMIAAGGSIVGGCAQLHLSPSLSSLQRDSENSGWRVHGGIQDDPRALRSGNLPSAFSVAHWLRDQRLTFGKNSVSLASSPIDAAQGVFPLVEDLTGSEVVIIGSGISGLAAAFYLSRERLQTRILFLDANLVYGGNASSDGLSPIPVLASTGGAYGVAPYADFLKEIYRETGVNWESHIIPSPFYNYFFDDQTPFVIPGTRRWASDVYGKGLDSLPYPPEVILDLKKARQDFIDWYRCEGAPTDPADQSDPKYDYLAQKTLHDYLVQQKHFHPAVSDFYTRFSIDALAGTSTQVNAHSAISFLGAEYHSLFAMPGGNAGISRQFLKWLIPSEESLDSSLNRVRMRQGAIALRIDKTVEGASITYFHNGKFYKTSAKAVIVATQAHSAQHLVSHLVDDSTKKAWRETTLVPVVVANVSIRRAAPLVDLGLGYNQYWWGSKYWADFVTADWMSPNRMDRNRPTVLTFYGGNTAAPEEMPRERMKLMTTPFVDYENSLREDLSRIFSGADFDFDRDVTAIYIYRWGHGMVYPKPGFPFNFKHGIPSTLIRKKSSRHIARQQVGCISFAGQDTEGTPSLESAIASGLRTAKETLGFL